MLFNKQYINYTDSPVCLSPAGLSSERVRAAFSPSPFSDPSPASRFLTPALPHAEEESHAQTPSTHGMLGG